MKLCAPRSRRRSLTADRLARSEDFGDLRVELDGILFLHHLRMTLVDSMINPILEWFADDGVDYVGYVPIEKEK